MTPSKKKLLKPKEVSLDPFIKVETPTAELPNDENQLFGDDVMLEHLPSLTFHYRVRMRKKKSSPTMSGNMLLMSYSNCPHFILKEKVSESGSNIKTFRLWKMKQQLDTSFQENSWDISNLEFLNINSIQNLHMLWKYLHT